MKICIVGGSGFIGSRLSSHLSKENSSFSIIDKQQSRFFPDRTYIADIRNVGELEEKIKLSAPDILINLAAEHKDNVNPVSLYDEVNVEGARNLTSIATSLNIQKIIFTSSVAVYGFAPADTDEDGKFNPFNDYGRTKMEAEEVFTDWQKKDPDNRSLTIIRPTVVFGERNRGNVYNLLKQITSGFFMMIGNGQNTKSMAYVENVVAFIQHATTFGPGIHTYNYVDKPDLSMNQLVSLVKEVEGKQDKVKMQIPYWIGYLGGLFFDFVSKVTKKEFPISAIRVKKFTATTQFASERKLTTGFKPPVSLKEGLERTIKYEFIDPQPEGQVLFYSE
ncbi:NAD-dependent epimerase/dehydratase family protein [Salinispira pacifica]|uniref:UDP-glucose 4-epimerase n=1 Tax=Salinispira pacifica TaxID=1307761 RepID=V5WL68_9SPIO|nr:NAD-dependent epimerase/dehydratase family protein [Salinispira pacifica]AHC16478.1 UDP-glucose 4-epimerase [Salinispira pacifica]